MSFVMTPRFTAGQNRRLRRSTRAVFPEPTGPAIPTLNALILFLLGSKQKISLSERQAPGRLACKQFPVRPHFVGLRIYFDPGHRRIVNHVAFADTAATPDRGRTLSEPVRDAAI